jgi:hypothetical protein
VSDLREHKHRWNLVEIEHYRCECGAELFGMVVWDHDLGQPCDCVACERERA